MDDIGKMIGYGMLIFTTSAMIIYTIQNYLRDNHGIGRDNEEDRDK